ncbi:MAG: hypothetical protein AB1704_09405 [Pseudomonadota bacterium]|jgi:hypothetical protein|uniref:hypothetical protein n=1 Tax=Burkholderiaceae TaxID=119060 RepID=UPI0010F6ECE9|nr:hypothetical protein [Burkholderia sp. 4M9327F10]
MKELSASGISACEVARLRALKAEEQRHWTVGIAITLVLLALLATALHFAASSANANVRLCLQQFANDEHVSLEAFFQNPAQQDAFVEAMSVCSR